MSANNRSTPALPSANAFSVFAEFETSRHPTAGERQFEGIANSKAAGVYKGRSASMDAARVRELKVRGMGPSEIVKALKIGRRRFTAY
jgi:DNA invertase Pin-like site-specific DNA recombinase